MDEPAKSRTDGLGMISDGLELPLSELPPVDESQIKIFADVLGKTLSQDELALQIHPSAIKAIHKPQRGGITD